MSDDLVQMNVDQTECAALAQFLRSRGFEADEVPAVLAEAAGYIVGRAIVLGFMTRDEGREFVSDRLRMRMLVALEPMESES